MDKKLFSKGDHSEVPLAGLNDIYWQTVKEMAKEKNEPRNDRKSILIVDDEVELVKCFKVFFEAKGYLVLTALNGQEGLEKIKSSRPDLIVLDIMLPDIKGSEICQKIKTDAHLKSIPVVMMSACSRKQDESQSYHADAYFEKPCNIDHLVDKIRELLDLSKEDVSIASSGSLSAKKILIIEDDPVDAKYMEMILDKEGFNNIRIATNGRDGIARARSFLPDLIILDTFLPDANGFLVCKILRSFHSLSPKIIMITELNDQVDCNQITEWGEDGTTADRFLKKSANYDALISAVHTLI